MLFEDTTYTNQWRRHGGGGGGEGGGGQGGQLPPPKVFVFCVVFLCACELTAVSHGHDDTPTPLWKFVLKIFWSREKNVSESPPPPPPKQTPWRRPWHEPITKSDKSLLLIGPVMGHQVREQSLSETRPISFEIPYTCLYGYCMTFMRTWGGGGSASQCIRAM